MTTVDVNKDLQKEKVLRPEETWRITKNVVVISCAFMLQFTAYNGVANLQSSINPEEGLGTAGLAAVYAGLIFSSLFLPAVVIRLLGCKWGVSLSLLTYTPYVGVQMKPSFESIIPAALIVGLGGGGLWCSKCTYLSVLSEAYFKITGIPSDVALIRFFGIFYTIFQLNQIWGNLISSLVLSSGDNDAALTAVNDSMIPELCGANFLPSHDAKKAFQTQPPEKIRLMIGVYLACMFTGSLLVAMFVDSKKRYDPILSDGSKKPSGAGLLAVTIRLLVEPNQLLLVPLNIFIGMFQAYISADFTAAYVSCPIGTGYVGYVIMIYGLSDVICCIGTVYLAKITGRAPLMTAAMIIQLIIFLVLLYLPPQANQAYVVFIIVIMLGFCDCIWLVQINSYYGILFPGREEGAYANFRVWESVGFLLSYLISTHLRTSVKTYILLVLMLFGMMCYYIVEYREYKRKKLLKKNDPIALNACDNLAFQ